MQALRLPSPTKCFITTARTAGERGLAAHGGHSVDLVWKRKTKTFGTDPLRVPGGLTLQVGGVAEKQPLSRLPTGVSWGGRGCWCSEQFPEPPTNPPRGSPAKPGEGPRGHREVKGLG